MSLNPNPIVPLTDIEVAWKAREATVGAADEAYKKFWLDKWSAAGITFTNHEAVTNGYKLTLYFRNRMAFTFTLIVPIKHPSYVPRQHVGVHSQQYEHYHWCTIKTPRGFNEVIGKIQAGKYK